MVPPTHCLIVNPHSNSVDFAGVYINLKQLAILAEGDHSYLSRVFNGIRPLPRVQYLRHLADILGMELTDFILALEDRVRRQGGRRSVKRQRVWENRHQKAGGMISAARM